ncbi:FMN-dependent NADH-azoreductase [[Acholeplasma] multilocale]|uniref:FMN-dependent NADH-azoreductase n=1 Tax=[Acholeplasma] multilocale TaxID=264638 RepID=UPI00047DBEE8|nr:FMN-dependent NADH-azoreductase [[Acholeplasma] multilocale]
MKKVLVLTGSANTAENSRSIELLNVFLEEYKTLNPNDEITVMDLNNEPMAHMTLSANNMGEFYNEENAMKYIAQLKEMDKLIISAPMHNYKITGLLGNYLDHIMVPNMAFSYKFAEKGMAKGLLDNLKVQILATQGSPLENYPWANNAEWLKNVWEFVGSEVNDTILLEGLDTPANNGKSAKELVSTKIEEI